MLLCEHASAYIPPRYNGLGLSPADLERHIAWDIGAAEVTRRLSDMLQAPAFLSTCSRLLIDLNRPLDSPASIVQRSEATDIVGNRDLNPAEIALRQDGLFRPYHDTVAELLDQRQTSGQPTRLVSVHSFTPVYLGQARSWHAGVLFGEAQAFGEAVLAKLQTPGFNIGANVPYQTSRSDDYGIPIHGDDRQIPAVMIEIRQDLIMEADGAAQWAERLAQALHHKG